MLRCVLIQVGPRVAHRRELIVRVFIVVIDRSPDPQFDVCVHRLAAVEAELDADGGDVVVAAEVDLYIPVFFINYYSFSL